jgi:hypothetical protein
MRPRRPSEDTSNLFNKFRRDQARIAPIEGNR